MREMTVDWLKGEALRLGAVIAEARILADSGARIHSPGDAITPVHLDLMTVLGMRVLHALEPGESEPSAAEALGRERVEASHLAAGDLLFGEVRGRDGRVLSPAGSTVDASKLEAMATAAPGTVQIRKRGLSAAREHARQYLLQAPPRSSRAKRPDTRVTQVTGARDIRLRFLLVPRARAVVALRDDFQRTLVANTLSAEGHEVKEVGAAGAAAAAKEWKAEVLVTDLASAAAVAGELRKSYPLFATAVIATAEEGKGGEVFKALVAGANGSVAVPPRRDLLLESVRGALAALGRSVRLAPHVLGDRRGARRENGNFACKLADKFLSKPLAVTDVMVLDVTGEGMRVEYTRPAWPVSWAYVGHSVHPKHYWYNYSRLNALGRDLTVVLAAPGRPPVEAQATVVHVALAGALEVIGLSLQRARDSVREHVTSIRGYPGGLPGTKRA